eukprot:114703_1
MHPNLSQTNVYQPPSQQGYSYATENQMRQYRSVYYANVHPNPQYAQPLHPLANTQQAATKYWMERNLSPQNIIQYDQPQNESNNAFLATPSVSDQHESIDSGYWDLPKPVYGPLASNNRLCEPKQPRIGDKYQAIIPSLQTDSKSTFEDECVWESHNLSPHQLDQYLNIVKFVIGTSSQSVYTDCHYDEEKALTLLKLHNYNIRDAISTLTLKRPDKNNSNFAWLFTSKSKEDKAQEIGTEDDLNDEDNHILYEYNRGAGVMNHMSQSIEDGTNDYQYDDEDYCFACGDGGNLLICDNKTCMKVWHIHCAGLTKMPEEEQWFCPSHHCCMCPSESCKKYMCSYCGNSYCVPHCPSECMHYDYASVEFLCATCLSQNDHDGKDRAHAFGAERFESRLLEQHKRKRNHINKILGKKPYKGRDVMPTHCKLGRTDIQWFDLYVSVIRIGGLSKIRDLSAWDVIRKKCGLNKNFQSENVWKSLRDSYIEYLYCYEKQYYPLTTHELPRGIQTIVDNKGALDGLFEPMDDDEDEEESAMMVDEDDNNNHN